MIYSKTKLDKIPENCLDCPIICDLPYEEKDCVSHIKNEYCYKRHCECPLIEIKHEEKANNDLIVDFVKTYSRLCLNTNFNKPTKHLEKHFDKLCNELVKRGILTSEDIKNF